MSNHDRHRLFHFLQGKVGRGRITKKLQLQLKQRSYLSGEVRGQVAHWQSNVTQLGAPKSFTCWLNRRQGHHQQHHNRQRQQRPQPSVATETSSSSSTSNRLDSARSTRNFKTFAKIVTFRTPVFFCSTRNTNETFLSFLRDDDGDDDDDDRAKAAVRLCARCYFFSLDERFFLPLRVRVRV